LVGFVTASHAAPSSGDEITVMGPSDLDQAAVESFLRCLNGTGVDYRLYVGTGGEMVVIPVQQRQIDSNGIDYQLMQCIMRHYDQLNIMTESTVYHVENHDAAISHRQATHELLARNGAVGQQPVGTEPPGTGVPRNESSGHHQSERSLIMPRVTLHYYGYLDIDKGCGNHDINAYYTRTCHSYPSSYASVRYENSSSNEWLHMFIWPHHECSKGNDRTFPVKPRTLSVCQNRPTYSFRGTINSCAVC
jgi:hypothetical protein